MKGSFTVELSFLFPIILLILIIFMQFGLYFIYRVYTLNVVDQSLTVCVRARQEKRSAEEAVQLAEAYLTNKLAQVPIDIAEVQCKTRVGWFHEEYTMWVTARYAFVLELSWTTLEKSSVVNPVEFRNRVDFIWEKGKQYMDQLKNSGGE